jgi:hypothetical protein
MNTHGVQRLANQHKMPARRCTQDITLTADTSDNSSPNVSKYNRKVIPGDENLTTFQMSQGLNGHPHEKARTYPETCEPHKDDGLEDWLDNSNLLNTPQIPTVALPEQEENEDFSYSGSESDLGGGLLSKLDGDPEEMLGCLDELDDDIFPKLFVIERLRMW